MKLGEIFPASVAGRLYDRDVLGVTSDSRRVLQGYIFVAIAGVSQDGAAFIQDAIKKGAIAIVAQGNSPIDLPDHVLYFRVPDARRILALIAAKIYARQPEIIVATTGTAGKTSVADFTRQIFSVVGKQAASVGTIGIVTPSGAAYGSLTTPDPVALHETFDNLAGAGITHLAIEASSHGLDQRRLDGVRLSAAAFTNLGRDHLDYHATLQEYMAAKMRLFNTLMNVGQPVVINADGAQSAEAIATAFARGLRIFSVGEHGLDLKITSVTREGFGQRLHLKYLNKDYKIRLPLVGEFQAGNALVAAGLAIVTGCEGEAVIAALEQLKGVKGRLEHVGEVNGAPVFVDYAHKPEALQHALQAVRPFTKGRIVLVFGCGGDRDTGKRPIMGKIAAQYADMVIITDDNPRSEDAALIRAAIKEAAPDALEIADRKDAIIYAVNLLKLGDCLIIAGKGHEEGQIVGTETLPFSDQKIAQAAIEDVVKSAPPKLLRVAAKPKKRTTDALWSEAEIRRAIGALMYGDHQQPVNGVSIDTRTLQKGDLYVAIKGDAHDGHDFTDKAFENGAAAALLTRAKAKLFKDKPVYAVPDTLRALEQMGEASRDRNQGKIIAVTGSVGKTSTKEALLHILSNQGRTHASVASYNNHWGVPLTLARMPQETEYSIFEIGMSAAGEITPLTKFVRPHVAMITTVEPVHLAKFANVEAIADAKGEIFAGIEAGGVAVLPRDNPHYDRLFAHAKASKAGQIISFGTHEQADVRLIKMSLQTDMSLVEANVGGELMAYKLGSPGKHMVMNSLGILASVQALGADLALAGLALASFTPASGRGAHVELTVKNGRFSLFDESYNANPASMKAAFDVLGRNKGRRIAVLGDMLELGVEAETMHIALKPALKAAGIDLVFACGVLVKPLFDVLDVDMQGGYAVDSKALEPLVLNAMRAGDMVMVKGSNGSKMGRIVQGLKARYGGG